MILLCAENKFFRQLQDDLNQSASNKESLEKRQRDVESRMNQYKNELVQMNEELEQVRSLRSSFDRACSETASLKSEKERAYSRVESILADSDEVLIDTDLKIEARLKEAAVSIRELMAAIEKGENERAGADAAYQSAVKSLGRVEALQEVRLIV